MAKTTTDEPLVLNLLEPESASSVKISAAFVRGRRPKRPLARFKGRSPNTVLVSGLHLLALQNFENAVVGHFRQTVQRLADDATVLQYLVGRPGS